MIYQKLYCQQYIIDVAVFHMLAMSYENVLDFNQNFLTIENSMVRKELNGRYVWTNKP